jgi:hypothetical protein
VRAERRVGGEQELVSHLNIVEGDVGGGGLQAVDEICGVIQGWPSTFASLAEVTAFFGSDTEAGRTWAACWPASCVSSAAVGASVRLGASARYGDVLRDGAGELCRCW